MPFFQIEFWNCHIFAFQVSKEIFRRNFNFFSLESFLSFSPIVCIFFQARGFTGSNSQKAFKWQTLFKRRFMASQQHNNNNKRKNVKNTIWHSLHFSVSRSTRQQLSVFDCSWSCWFLLPTSWKEKYLLASKNVTIFTFLRYCRFSYFVGWQ